MDKVQKPTNSECYTPSSEPIRINFLEFSFSIPGTSAAIDRESIFYHECSLD
jgi:hypothetical protein